MTGPETARHLSHKLAVHFLSDTPDEALVSRMAEAYLRTDRSDKPRRFLCLLGEKNKVLLTFFTAR